jgi:predicted dienelactone hydrolase
MSWFKRFLEEHSQVQMDELKPIAEEMRVVFDELDGLRKMKIEEARHMEETHDKHKRAQRRKKATTIKHEITNEPLTDLPNTPPEDAVDINALFQAAKTEIDSK